MKIYHLSHTDLDGYACQFVVNFYFKNVVFFNSNYGREISDTFAMILGEIEKDLAHNPNEKFLVLISDLNLNLTQCEDFEKALQGKNAKLLLLDHHQSGLECSQKYEWYFLDNARCAAKIVYEFFARICGENEPLARFIAVVNAVDIWLKDDENFELGKVCLMMISTAKEINRVMFNEQNIHYMFYLLEKAQSFIGKVNSNIALEDSLHFLKKEFFKGEKNDTLGNLLSAFVVRLLRDNKEKLTLHYNGHKGILTYSIGNTSVIGNDFLLKEPEFDFFIDISSKKTLSFRANGKLDVSQMAQKLVGGGGHKNASGGLFVGFKDSSDYFIVKAQVEDLIKSKEMGVQK